MRIEVAVVMGPGGSGKGPLDCAFKHKDEVARVDPYRLRCDGPRGAGNADPFYGHPLLRGQMQAVLKAAGQPDPYETESMPGQPILWYPAVHTLLFKVRKEWQLMITQPLYQHGTPDRLKAELYAPVLLEIVRDPELGGVLGDDPTMVVLNPSVEEICRMSNWDSLEEATRENCEKRGDTPDSVETRVNSIKTEAPEWVKLIEREAADRTNWEWAECRYKDKPPYTQRELLCEARDALVACCPSIERFLKTPDEIRAMADRDVPFPPDEAAAGCSA